YGRCPGQNAGRASHVGPVPGGGSEGLAWWRGEVDGLLWFGNAAGLLNRVGLEVGHPEVKQVVAREPGDLELGGQGLRRTVDELASPGRGALYARSVYAIAGTERHGRGHLRPLFMGNRGGR